MKALNTLSRQKRATEQAIQNQNNPAATTKEKKSFFKKLSGFFRKAA